MRIRAAPRAATGGVQRESTLQGPPSERHSEQYSLAKILGIWAAAALPMGALAWVVALAKILGIWAAAALPMGALAWVVAPLVAPSSTGP